MFSLLLILACLLPAWSHETHFSVPDSSSESSEKWTEKYGKQFDQPFSGPLSFSHLPYHRCLEAPDQHFDYAVLGLPFDTGVTYRPGARFGPYAIRSGSRRQRVSRAFTLKWGIDPYVANATVLDCGDVCISSSSWVIPTRLD